MKRIDANFILDVGYDIRLVSTITDKIDENTDYLSIYIIINRAGNSLRLLLTDVTLVIETAKIAGVELLEKIDVLENATVSILNNEESKIEEIDIIHLKELLTTFLNVLRAEFQWTPLFIVSSKAAYNTNVLIEDGIRLFPSQIGNIVKSAAFDLKEGTCCIAFELPTAAAFHFHRACEAVVKEYYLRVSNGESLPKNPNLGILLGKMKEKSYGKEQVISALEGLKNFHRNPTMHPEQNIENIEEAIGLMNHVYVVIQQMLVEMLEQNKSIE